MYLKSLELFGFKSFPEKTILKFEPGTTVVVGPNGCGKSNVFDAIKWALGEQSPKSLRGSKMEDIIFNGTEHYAPLNYTEVILTFSNEDNYLPIDYKEVAVSRKLYRSGESEYYLNKNLARLKDIQNMFSGTGVGESSYSFVEQGKIEIFLSCKPEEKRLIFDEASGIIKYKERKKEALNKLQDTDQNLLRLEDIIAEVRRQIRYLERQVAKANKYKEIEERLIDTEKRAANINFKAFSLKIDILLEELNEFKNQECVKDREISDYKKGYQDFNEKVKNVKENLEVMSSTMISLNSKIELYRNTVKINHQRIEERRQTIKNIEENLNQLELKILSQEKKIEQERKNSLFLDNDLNRLSGEIEELKNTHLACQKEKEELKTKIAQIKQEILSEEVAKANINNELIEVQTYLKNLYARKRRLLLDKEKLANFFQEREEVLLKVGKELEEIERSFLEFKAESQRLEVEVTAQAEVKEELTARKIEKEKKFIELNSHYEFLKDLRVKYGGFHSMRKVKVFFDEPPSNINKLIISLKEADFYKSEIDGKSFWAVEVEAKAVLFEEEELKERILGVSREIEEMEIALRQAKDKEKEMGDNWRAINSKISEFDKKQGEKSKETDSLNQEFSRIKEEFELLDMEIKDNSANIEETDKTRSIQEENLKEKETILVSLKDSLDNSQKQDSALAEEIKSTEIAITKKQAEANSLKNSKDAVSERVVMFEEERVSILRSIEQLTGDKKRGLEKITLFDKESSELEQDVVRNGDEINRLIAQKEGVKAEENSLSENMQEIAAKINEIEANLQNIRNCIYDKKLKIQEVEFEKSRIVTYLKQVYNIEFKPFDSEDDVNPKELLDERDRLKKNIDLLGEVNLVAIDESEELNSRYRFLDEQKNDLVASKEELKKAIQKINRTSRQIFLEVFSKINEEFKKNYRFLFGGGRAELILLDEENVLESGVDIEVQPPGKKLQNVSLLSGGEKSLTAIALIFAIFKIRPSPLCVLDEIDAPLDEANVVRFNHLLKEFSQRSQFIIITHNKKTMSNADVLYGVTMQEKGISKIVSVKFAQEPQESLK